MSWAVRRAVLDVFLTRRAGAAPISRRQRQRLDGMIGYARARSPFYRKLYADLPSGAADPGVLPPVTKPQLMEHFDEVVTDRSVTRAAVEQFPADPGNVGQPFMDSLDQQAGELNQFQPQALGGYPSAILLLAREQAAGRLHIKPLFIIFVGENVPASARRFIEETFGCRSYEEYGSTENGVMAVQCREGWLHYNADWYLLEPVDTSYRPVPAGARSDTVLVTNLTNRLLPTIRYDQGDCILLKPDPCTCGSAYPAIRVTGRTDDLLNLPARSGGGIVTVTPLSLVAAIEEVPGVYRIQIVHQQPHTKPAGVLASGGTRC